MSQLLTFPLFPDELETYIQLLTRGRELSREQAKTGRALVASGRYRVEEDDRA